MVQLWEDEKGCIQKRDRRKKVQILGTANEKTLLGWQRFWHHKWDDVHENVKGEGL